MQQRLAPVQEAEPSHLAGHLLVWLVFSPPDPLLSLRQLVMTTFSTPSSTRTTSGHQRETGSCTLTGWSIT